MTRRSFRRLVVLEWILGFAAVVVYYTTLGSLPPQLQAYLAEVSSAEIPNTDLLVFSLGVFLMIGSIVIYIGLYLFKKWAKTLLLPLHVIALVAVPFAGPHVDSGLAYASDCIYLTVSGGVLFLVYLSPVAQMFENNDSTPVEQ